jgi:predicted oxidoreductase (fatty acid repression mutant protein)
VYHYSHNNPNAATDSAGLVALRNAAPELIAAARERDELVALLRRLRANHPSSNNMKTGVRQMLSGEETHALWEEADAALAKVGP